MATLRTRPPLQGGLRHTVGQFEVDILHPRLLALSDTFRRSGHILRRSSRPRCHDLFGREPFDAAPTYPALGTRHPGDLQAVAQSVNEIHCEGQ